MTVRGQRSLAVLSFCLSACALALLAVGLSLTLAGCEERYPGQGGRPLVPAPGEIPSLPQQAEPNVPKQAPEPKKLPSVPTPPAQKPISEMVLSFMVPSSESARLLSVSRPLAAPSTDRLAILRESLKALFAGPTAEESNNGVFTEIPPGVSLQGLVVDDKAVIVNLSPEFNAGGGSYSVQTRWLQVEKTVNRLFPGKDVLLQLNGVNLDKPIGGEGLEVQ